MRVLVVHNRYRTSLPSGENRVVEIELDGLRSRGIDVTSFLPESDELTHSRRARAGAALGQVVSSHSLRRLAERLLTPAPDVLHLHNPFPMVPPALLTAAQRRGTAVVQTLHNGRHGCPKSDFLRDGGPCYDCLRRKMAWPAVAHACYRDSRPQTLMLASSLAINRGRFDRLDRFIALSQAHRRIMSQAPLPAERIVVVPHGIPDPGEATHPGRTVLFFGRLEYEKGLTRLLDIWRRRGGDIPWPLVIAGSGELEPEVRRAEKALPGLRWAGRLDPASLQDEIKRAAVVVVPSLVPESYGLTAVEAFAAGRPVVASRIGGLPELVDDSVGWLVDDDAGLESTLLALRADEVAARGRAARQRYVERFTVERSHDRLLEVFDDAIAARRRSPADR